MKNYTVVYHDEPSGNTCTSDFGPHRTDALDHMARQVGRLVVFGHYIILDRGIDAYGRLSSVVLTTGTSLVRLSLREVNVEG